MLLMRYYKVVVGTMKSWLSVNFEYFIAFDETTFKSFVPSIMLMLVTITFLLQVISTHDGENIWKNWIEDGETRNPVYAERIYMTNVFRTSSNTWSNLFYVFVGYYAVTAGCFDFAANSKSSSSNYLLRYPYQSFLFGIACIHLGIGSGLYHASLTLFGRQLDVASMYSPLMVLISISIGRWYPKLNYISQTMSFSIDSWPLHAIIIIVAAYLFFLYKWSMDSSVVLPLLIVTAYGVAIADRFYYPSRTLEMRWMVLSFVALLIGVACRVLDVLRMFSGPDDILQGHSFWHFFTSLSMYWMYLHHRSEKSQSFNGINLSADATV